MNSLWIQANVANNSVNSRPRIRTVLNIYDIMHMLFRKINLPKSTIGKTPCICTGIKYKL